MTTAITHAHRSWLPTLTLVLAGGAAALSVVAITSDDVGTTTPVQTPAPADMESPVNVPVYERMPAGWPATDAMRRDATTNGSAERARNVEAPTGMSDAPSRRIGGGSAECYDTPSPLNIC